MDHKSFLFAEYVISWRVDVIDDRIFSLRVPELHYQGITNYNIFEIVEFEVWSLEAVAALLMSRHNVRNHI